VLTAVLVVVGFLFLRQYPPVQQPPPPANLSVSGNVVPGGSIELHGSHFPPDSTAEITVDGIPVTSRKIGISASIGDIFIQEGSIHLSVSTVTVESDGTFDKTLPVPASWTPGSRHTIQATTQNAQASIQASVDVEVQSSRVVPPPATPPTAQTVSPTATPIPGPIISGIVPTSGPASGGTSISLSGTHFSNASSVSFGSQKGSNVKVVSDTRITVDSPAVNKSGTVDITVTTPGGTSATTSADRFTYIPVPVISSVSPNRGSVEGGTLISLTGSGFSNASEVSFGSQPGSRLRVISDTRITVDSPAVNKSGTVDITVTTPGGTSATTSADRFTYIPVPVISSISPKSGSTKGGTSVTIIGSGFSNASEVSFGSQPGSRLRVISDTEITVDSPAVDESDTVDITVTTPGGTSATSSDDEFTYIPVPVISSISLKSGSVKGGTTLTLTGTHFTNASRVAFGSQTASNFTVVSDTEITVVSPAVDKSGTVHITVTTPGGTSATSSADQFTYIPVPVISSIDPKYGSTKGRTKITLTGSGFTNATSVAFGSQTTSNFTVVSDTEITVVSPAVGKDEPVVHITVTTPGGTSATSSDDQFTYYYPDPDGPVVR
jgi:hypothetical protein